MNKADFIRAGARGATYLAFRKAIQEVVSRQLEAWGDSRDTGSRARLRAARPVERDLEAVLSSLADRFPLLASLVEQRAGGQRKLPTGHAEPDRPAADLGDEMAAGRSSLARPGPNRTKGEAERSSPTGDGPAEPPVVPSEPRPAGTSEIVPRAPRQPTRYGLSIQFEPRPDDPGIARLLESTVWVNEAHPAHRRAVASHSEGYHVALAVAMALAPLAVEPARQHTFVTAFLASWGSALDRRPRRRRDR